MKHQVKGKKLSRDFSERKALFKSLINSLIIHGEIKTTESKAKAIRGLVDKLITKGKKGTFQTRRLIGAFLQNKMAVNKIVDEIAPVAKSHFGGFTRIVRLGRRRGDRAMMVKIELLPKPQKEEKKEKGKTEKKSKKSKVTKVTKKSKTLSKKI
jgi:large subunit ribosomal protein L17